MVRFPIPRQAVLRSRRRFIIGAMAVVVGVTGVILWVGLSQLARLDAMSCTCCLLTLVLPFSILFAVTAFRALKWYQVGWELQEFEMGKDYIAIRQMDTVIVRIQREEILRVQDTGKTLRVFVANEDYQSIPVQPHDDEYYRFRNILSTWLPIERVSRREKVEKTVLTILLVVGFGIVLLSWSRWLTLIIALALAGYLTYDYWRRRRDKYVTPRFKELYPKAMLLLAVMTLLKFSPLFGVYSRFVRSLFFLPE